MWITNKIRSAMRSFLQIENAQANQITINEQLDFISNAAKNRIWYRGKANELSQLYKQISTDRNMFWAAVPTRGMEIRKAHTGIPKLMVDVITAIVCADMNEVKLPEGLIDRWEKIAKENDFKGLIEKAVAETLTVGDGAFKISIDSDISSEPIIEFYPGDRIEFVRKRGRITEVIFKTVYNSRGRKFILNEHYGYGYVRYELLQNDRIVPMNSIDEASDLCDVEFDSNLILAVPFMIYKNSDYEGRGRSIFDGGKTDSFDSLDEAWSQWMYAVRQARPVKYFPPEYVPKNPFNGTDMLPNPFDNVFIEGSGVISESGAAQRPELIQPDIPHDAYLATYITALDLALQGIISPSTLGIDVKKLDNAEAQREKEKTTLYTRNKIVGTLQQVLPQLIQTVFNVIAVSNNDSLSDIDIEVPFGEYANPSFESQVETVGKGRTTGIMSIEASIDELYGDSKDEEWKSIEVQRIKAQTGVETMSEPVFTE